MCFNWFYSLCAIKKISQCTANSVDYYIYTKIHRNCKSCRTSIVCHILILQFFRKTKVWGLNFKVKNLSCRAVGICLIDRICFFTGRV